MANDSKTGIFSTFFGRGNKAQKEALEAAELEARQRLERRIEQALAVVSDTLEAQDIQRDAA